MLATLNLSTNGATMPKNEVTDPITGQEIAAETVGLHPDSASVQQELVDQGTDPSRRAVEDPHPFNVSRGQILTRLWEIANMNPEITRGSLVGQVKVLTMIVAIEGLIPDRRAASAQTKPAPPQETPEIYEAEWLRNQRSGKNVDPQPNPPQEETASERSSAPYSAPTAEPTPAPVPAVSQHQAEPANATPTPSLAPRVPMADHFAPDTRVPFSIKNNRFGRRR